jgi:hypothetical protein
MGLRSQEHYNTVGCPILDASWPWLTQSWAANTRQNYLKKCAMVCQKVPLSSRLKGRCQDSPTQRRAAGPSLPYTPPKQKGIWKETSMDKTESTVRIMLTAIEAPLYGRLIAARFTTTTIGGE